MLYGKLKDLEKMILQNFSPTNFLILSAHFLPQRKLLKTMPPPIAREIKFSQTSPECNKIQLMLLKMNFCNISLCVSLSRKTERDTNKNNLKDFWTPLRPIISNRNLSPWMSSALNIAKSLRLWSNSLTTSNAQRSRQTTMIWETKLSDLLIQRSSTISSVPTEPEEVSLSGCCHQLDTQTKRSEELIWDSSLEQDSWRNSI